MNFEHPSVSAKKTARDEFSFWLVDCFKGKEMVIISRSDSENTHLFCQ